MSADGNRPAVHRVEVEWTPEGVERFRREASVADELEWRRLVGESLDRLSSALFAHSVLVRGASAGDAAVLSADLRDVAPMDPRSARRLARLRVERDWLATLHAEDERLHGARWAERMWRILREANALHSELEVEVRRHLAGGGLSPGEIRRRTEAAERLWRAA